MSFRPDAMPVLLAQLRRAGVTLPAEVSDAVATLENIAEVSEQVLALPPIDPLCGDRDQLVAALRQRAILGTVRAQLGPVMYGLLEEITAAVAAVLRAEADDLISQLRPRFDEAAAAVHAATKTGIHPGIHPDAVMSLGNRAITAWRSLPAHAGVLDDIAGARIALSDVLDIAPREDPFGPRQYGAAFSTSVPTWDPKARGVNRWLEVTMHAQPEPLTLVTVAQAHAADVASRVEPVPTAVDIPPSMEPHRTVYYR